MPMNPRMLRPLARFQTPPEETTPGAPTSVSGTRGDTQVALSWSAPSSNGGSAITDYIVQYSSDSGSTWSTFSDGTSTGTSTTVTGLSNGTAYVFRVAAVNAIGTGSYSAASAAVTPATTPGAPTSVTPTAGNAQVSLVWTAPASTGGDAITDYAVQYSSNSGSTWTTFSDGTSTATSATVTGLTNGTAYVFRVAAVNAVSAGSYSTASASVTPATTPGAPTSVSGTSGDAQVSLTWSAPSSNGGSSITDYAVQYSSNSGTSWTTFSDGTSTATSATVTGLTNGTGYVFRVAATNAVGTGSYSSASASVTPAASGTPSLLLLHFDGNLTDSSAEGQTVTAVGDAATTTAEAKFGSGSVVFDGTGDSLEIDGDFSFAGDYTIEFWFRVSDADEFYSLIGFSGGTNMHVHTYTDGKLYANDAATGMIDGGTVVADTWHHVALVRSSGTTSLYQDGALVGSTGSAIGQGNGVLQVGNFGGGGALNGYIDELRVVETAVYTAAFTPPSAPLSANA